MGPLGHLWGTWGQDLRRDRTEYFQNIISSLFGVHMTSQYHRTLSPQEKFLNSFPPDVYTDDHNNTIEGDEQMASSTCNIHLVYKKIFSKIQLSATRCPFLFARSSAIQNHNQNSKTDDLTVSYMCMGTPEGI